MSKQREPNQAARAAEQRGDVDEAARIHLAAGDVEEAARVFMSAGQFAKAGRVLFRAVGLPLDRMNEATSEQKKTAIRAGICLAKGGDVHNAAALLSAAGDRRRAIEVLERSGDTASAARLRAMEASEGPRAGHVAGQVNAAKYATGLGHEQAGDFERALSIYIQTRSWPDAARMAHKLGKVADAGGYFEEAGLYYEAAVCWDSLKDTRRCLDALTRVPRDHARYRGCALKAIHLSVSFGEVSFELDQFLTRFLAAGPESPQEIEAFVALGRLYDKAGFLENARECYRKVLEVAPQHAAQALLRELEQNAKGSNMVYEKIMREDGAFHSSDTRRRQALGPADLPDLPPLPGTPPRPLTPQHTQHGLGPAAYPPQPAGYPRAPAPASPEGYAPPHYAGSHASEPTPSTGVVAALAELPQLPGARSDTMVKPREPAREQAVSEQTGQLRTARDAGPLELAPGVVIAERYRLEKQIGQGGTAVVFKAHDLELEEDVAIKVFTVAIDDPELVRRFKQELSVTRQLSHPNVVRLHDIGTHRGFRFLTMEILQGKDLGSVLQDGPLPLAKSLEFLVQACAGLHLAHERGIVHRDIKPENFFVTTQNVLKVMDFGIAKRVQASQKLTQAGFIAGTPPYMSPEQISGFAHVTHLADVYSLGIVAYEMFTGSLPFVHDEMMPMLLMHLNDAPEPPIKRNPRIPKPLDELVLRCLEKQPNMRIQSMRELAQELLRVRSSLA